MLAYSTTPSYTYFSELKASAEKLLGKFGTLEPVTCLENLALHQFVEVIDRADMRNELNSMAALTIFAPTNEAFEYLSEDERQRMLGDTAGYRNFVRDHVAIGYVKAIGNENDTSYLALESRSLRGNKATIMQCYRPEPGFVYSSSSYSATGVALFNCRAINGGITIIDAVLGSSERRTVASAEPPKIIVRHVKAGVI